MTKSVTSKPPGRSLAYSKRTRGHVTVFLAGSIEMGKAEDWQTEVQNAIPEGVTFLNPRRDDWDSSWKQEITNPQFKEQVEWELENLRAADIIFLYFQPETMSPISLLELGLFARSNLVVCCPKGFWRKGNVDIVCEQHNIRTHDFFDTAVIDLKRRVDLAHYSKQ